MGIDYSGFAFPKNGGRLVVEAKRDKRLEDDALERDARKEATKRYGRGCCVPGCKERGEHLHHIEPRSRSRAKRWLVSNVCYLCAAHHQLLHAGKIQVSPRTADGELIVTGAKKYLEFKL